MNESFKVERKLAIKAAKDFMSYGEPGYDQKLIDNLEKAENMEEVRALLRKARAVTA